MARNLSLDPLTELDNFFALIQGDVGTLFGEQGVVIALDLIGLHDFNKKQGREAGDQYLRCLSDVLRYVMENYALPPLSPTLYRFGGDEFIVILRNADATTAQILSDRIVQEFMDESGRRSIVKAGVRSAMIVYTHGFRDIEDVMGNVISALYETRLTEEDGEHQSDDLVDQVLAFMTRRIRETLTLLHHTHSLAHQDDISGLPNHRAGAVALDDLEQRAKTMGDKFSVLFIDGDNLKQYNSLGYHRGNQMIHELADLLLQTLRSSDRVFRWLSGDEFVVLLPGAGRDAARNLAERIRTHVAYHAASWPFPVTLSIGSSTWSDDGWSANGLIHAAEQANARAKQKGKNCVVCSGDPD